MWYCSGLGYVMSVMLEPQNSMVASVAIVLVLGGFFNGVEPRFRTLTPTMKAVFGAPHPPLAEVRVMPKYWQLKIGLPILGHCAMPTSALCI